jgi:hypothetical protein
LGITRITEAVMDIDTEKVDEAVLAVLYLTLHDHVRAWKGIDWDALARLHQKGLIEEPAGKQKSVVFTDEGLRRAEHCFRKLFDRS